MAPTPVDQDVDTHHQFDYELFRRSILQNETTNLTAMGTVLAGLVAILAGSTAMFGDDLTAARSIVATTVVGIATIFPLLGLWINISVERSTFGVAAYLLVFHEHNSPYLAWERRLLLLRIKLRESEKAMTCKIWSWIQGAWAHVWPAEPTRDEVAAVFTALGNPAEAEASKIDPSTAAYRFDKLRAYHVVYFSMWGVTLLLYIGLVILSTALLTSNDSTSEQVIRALLTNPHRVCNELERWHCFTIGVPVLMEVAAILWMLRLRRLGVVRYAVTMGSLWKAVKDDDEDLMKKGGLFPTKGKTNNSSGQENGESKPAESGGPNPHRTD